MRWSIGALLLAVLLPAAALAEDRVRVVPADGRHGPVHARLGDVVELTVERVDRRGRGRPLPAGATVRWLRVVPHMQHEDTPPPNDDTAQYSNSVLFGEDHGRWLGYDAVEYETRPLEGGDAVTIDGHRVELRAVPTPEGATHAHRGAGSMWIAAEVTLPEGTTLRTPDGDDTDRLGLSDDVVRVSFRVRDDFVGWLSTYYHVPNIFGSTAPQADRYVGADCADVLVAALRAGGNRRVRYTSVRGIGRYARAVTPVLRVDAEGRITDADGEAVTLRWGEDLRRGDLLAIDYARPGSRLPRAWDHIGALVGDGSPANGRLDASDHIRHMTPRGLADMPIARQGAIRFRIWRLRAGIRAIRGR